MPGCLYAVLRVRTLCICGECAKIQNQDPQTEKAPVAKDPIIERDFLTHCMVYSLLVMKTA